MRFLALILATSIGHSDELASGQAGLTKLLAIDRSFAASQLSMLNLLKAEATRTNRPLFLSIGTDPPTGLLSVRVEEYEHYAAGQTLVALASANGLKVIGMLPAHRSAEDVEKSLTAPVPIMAAPVHAPMPMMRSFGGGFSMGGFGANCFGGT